MPYTYEENPWDDAECGGEEGLSEDQIFVRRQCVVTANLYKLPERLREVTDGVCEQGPVSCALARWGEAAASGSVAVPSRLLKRDGQVDLDQFNFNNPIKGMGGDAKGYKSYVNNKTGWFVQKDVGDNHGGSAWKRFDGKGNRKATLDKDGRILRD